MSGVSPQIAVLATVGVLLAFVAGDRWRKFRRAVADHKAAVATASSAKRTKRLTLRAMVVAIVVLGLYIAANGVGARRAHSNPAPLSTCATVAPGGASPPAVCPR